MLNILVRTSNRPYAFDRLMKSILSQTYQDFKIIVSTDNDYTYNYVSSHPEVDVIVRNEWTPKKDFDHNPYNLYFNKLIDEVNDGWIYFADDDNVIADNYVFSRMMTEVDKQLVYVFKVHNEQNNLTIPNRSFRTGIMKNDIDTGNILIHSSVASKFKWKPVRTGDYHYISDVYKGIGHDRFVWVDHVILRMPNGAGLGTQDDIEAPSMICNICGYSGKYKNMNHRVNAICPNCQSYERHRHFWHIFSKIVPTHRPLNLLHIAPEISIARKIQSNYPNIKYSTSSYDGKGTDFKIDIQDIPLRDSSFDIIICSHVLEHVPDDNKAISELMRVIKPNSPVFIMVPIKKGTTIDDPTYNTPELRTKHYGQDDHLRFYGYDDFHEKFSGYMMSQHNPFMLQDYLIKHIINPTVTDTVFVIGKK